MQTSGQTTIWTYLIIAALVGFAMYRRTRQQQVRPTRSVVVAVIIVLVSAVGLASTGRSHPLAFVLAPLALAAGFGLGWLMMGTINFWRDDATGELWMKGGALYIAIWLITFVVRLGVTTLSGGQAGSFARGPAPSQPEALAIFSAELLFLSMGLWIARASALVYRYRLNQRVS